MYEVALTEQSNCSKPVVIFSKFQGDCSYVLAEDYCGKQTGTFRIAVETIPCGDTGVTCTKAVTFHLYNHVIHLTKQDDEPVRTTTFFLVG